ncbi:MAG: polymerase, sigma-24 subunit, subfamily [Solirubrobacterales bacterium]|nr:polymerase, sigma-24 subunit, subfamily [Solirubrobacterales bacterium]
MAGDDAFEELWNAHHRRVLAYALRRTDRGSAQDVVSDAFLVAWRRRAELPADPLPWLLGVARHVLANHDRSRRRHAALVRVLIDQSQESAGEPPDVPLLAALAELEPGDREVLLLVGWDGLTSAQAGASMGCSAATFRVRLLRARRRLRARLEDQPAAHPEGAPS